MPLIDRTEQIDIGRIVVSRDERQRRKINTDGLRQSMARNGLISAIIVRRIEDSDQVILIAGERRLQSATELGWKTILARWAEDLTNEEMQIIELEENIKRSDLEWPDLVKAVARIHSLYLATDSEWNGQLTANACNISAGIVSMYLTVAKNIEDENVAKSGTVREAYNLLLRRKKRADGDALQELLEDLDNPSREIEKLEGQTDLFDLSGASPPQDFAVPEGHEETGMVQVIENITPGPSPGSTLVKLSAPIVPPESILCEDFVEWIKSYEGRKFNLIHCDFPYGVNLFSSNGVRSGPNRSQMGRDEGESYDDGAEVYQILVETLAKNLEKIASVSCHFMFWFSNKWEIEQWTRETFSTYAPSVQWSRFPLVWLKSDNAGIAASPNFEPRHIYETCLFGNRGKRQIVKIKSDAYSAPTDKSIHTSAKPEPMLRHFMEMLVDENSVVFDPTCGSGTSLRAAESLGAKFVLGLEKDPRMAEMARGALKNARRLRAVAREF